MKITKILCDVCGREWLDYSPPPNDQYENGTITILDGSMMLIPERSRSRVAGVATAWAASLGGFYCDYKCLLRRIMQILKKDDPELKEVSLPPQGRQVIIKNRSREE